MRIDQSNIPYIKPLYWKWIWSTIKKPGWRKMDADIIRCIGGSIEPLINLYEKIWGGIQGHIGWTHTWGAQSQAPVPSESLLSFDIQWPTTHRSSNCLGRLSLGQWMTQVWIEVSPSRRRTVDSPVLSHSISMLRPDRRPVRTPLRCCLGCRSESERYHNSWTHIVVPFWNRKAVGNSKPVPMHLKISRSANHYNLSL